MSCAVEKRGLSSSRWRRSSRFLACASTRSDFGIWHGDRNAVLALLRSWAKPPAAIDFILNIVLYAPLGAFGALSLSLRRSRRPSLRIGIPTLGAAFLSILIELTQYFDAARITAASDVYANVLGAFIAAVAVVVLFRR